ncbi:MULTISPECIES: aspartate--tRNA ligase [Holospora]|uniref:Aspartate--tRNA(Asp/Asn) ligase n=2 Tax=Holospora TaxID=44747 RepID=A0A061JGE7_9PROT|nr:MULTISPECIES: aspartate--tRNA ligase [Holospora]ETZ05055.1 aspartate--tRNA ligase [Holospora undulata HU1]GAJ46339.1 aspartate--tRNA ligase [Holospora elegans E1]
MNSVYRTKYCGALRSLHEGESVKLSGWIHRKRDHGQLLFIDLRDHYGTAQCVVDPASPAFVILEHASLESVVFVEGIIVLREPHLINTKIETGEVEVKVQTAKVLSYAAALPLNVNSDESFPEETRLKYRFLDLRRPKLHQHIVTRSKVIQFLREKMQNQGFLEIQTPILTGTSPEGARDYVVPSRLYPGQFYALPQAPQQFKQLLMASGFDKYFQISPCFRDEDPRADRSPGEFYQLDMEMAFVTQEEVFSVLEPVLRETFQKFAPQGWHVPLEDFPRIPYEKALEEYGSDKPDLRNPLKISTVSDLFRQSSFGPFQETLRKKGVIRALNVPGLAEQPRQFLKNLEAWAMEQGAPGLGYILKKKEKWQGPLVKFFSEEEQWELSKKFGQEEGTGICFMAGPEKEVAQLLGKLRVHLWKILTSEEEKTYRFCWIVDFPMYAEDSLTQQIVFSHNPFSMPQGGMEALEQLPPLDIKAFQYDIVCNGIELCSGAIRNHDPEIMKKAFRIAGYEEQEVFRQFGALLNAFRYGVPPHGGGAPGIERIVMLLCEVPNIREVIAFPWTQQGKDLLMQAPGPLPAARWKELHLRPNQ